MKNYKATLFHPQGDSVSDFYNRQTIDEVWSEINDMGSRWIFYPISFVTTDKTIVDTPHGLEFLKGKRIKTAAKFFSEQWAQRADAICNLIESGAPFYVIY